MIQVDKEHEFPFDRDPKCWYVVFYVKDGGIAWDVVPNSYKSSLGVLACICRAIEELGASDTGRIVLMGVWHGKYSTDLFLLKPKKTLEILSGRGFDCWWRETKEYWKEKLGISLKP